MKRWACCALGLVVGFGCADPSAVDPGTPEGVCAEATNEYGDVCADDFCVPPEDCAIDLRCAYPGLQDDPEQDAAFWECLGNKARPDMWPAGGTEVAQCGDRLEPHPDCAAVCAKVESCLPDQYAEAYGGGERDCMLECTLREAPESRDCMLEATCDELGNVMSSSPGGLYCGCADADHGACIEARLGAECR